MSTHNTFPISGAPLPPRFALFEDPYDTVIRDVEHGLNIFFLAESGFGLRSDARRMAERVVNFLNSLPRDETLLYPFHK